MSLPSELDSSLLPHHIAIIMDGNGRWAQQRGQLRIMGHKVGVESVRDIVRAASRLGIGILTLYAFSTENWKRPTLEVSTLMTLLQTYLKSELAEMRQNNIQLRCIGQQDKLPKGPRKILEKTIQETRGNTGLILNLALSYGSRQEIVKAVRELAALCVAGTISPDDITEEAVRDRLYTAELADPDLIIRTGGEYRLSNFLLWQASYAELYVTETMWPDFRENQLIDAIVDYQRRQRRFGQTGDQIKGRGNK